MSYQVLPIGVAVYEGDDTANTYIVDGIRTELIVGRSFTYSYGVYALSTYGGDDVVYLRNLTAIEPNGANPRGRQVVDLGAGNDFAEIRSLTAATVYGGDGNDSIIKVDLRATSTGNTIENGWAGAAYYSAPRPDGTTQDINWLDYNIVDGGAGDDTIAMGNGNDWIYGGDGADNISLGLGTNVAFAGAGDDTILALGLGYQVVTGGLPPSAYSVYGVSSNAIWAGDGNDTVTISLTQNSATLVAVVNGEGGSDTISVSSASAVWLTGGDGNDTMTMRALDIQYIYNTFYAEPADTAWGEAGDDLIDTELGNDLLVGGTGRDWLFGGFGSDNFYGGAGGAVGDGETDRFSFGNYFHRTFNTPFINNSIKDVDSIYDFQPEQRFVGQVGRGDVIDVAAMFNAENSDALVYDAGNPFTQGELQLVLAGADTQVQAKNIEGGWDTFLILYGVTPGELDTLNQADVTAGLVAKSGGDFLWFTG